MFHVPCIDQIHKSFQNTKKFTRVNYFVFLKILRKNCLDMMSKPKNNLK